MSKKILVIDDEASIRESLGKVLRAENYEVELAESGEAAVERQGAVSFDLVLLDLNLPAKTGWATLQWLADVNPLLPVIIITGRSEQRALAEKAGADALMEKPLDVPFLLQTIRELLDEPMEQRVWRARNRASDFRYAPCDGVEFREGLLQRLTTPYVMSGITTDGPSTMTTRSEPVSNSAERESGALASSVFAPQSYEKNDSDR